MPVPRLGSWNPTHKHCQSHPGASPRRNRFVEESGRAHRSFSTCSSDPREPTGQLHLGHQRPFCPFFFLETDKKILQKPHWTQGGGEMIRDTGWGQSFPGDLGSCQAALARESSIHGICWALGKLCHTELRSLSSAGANRDCERKKSSHWSIFHLCGKERLMGSPQHENPHV